MATSTAPADGSLKSVDIHDVLANERRRHVLEFLRAAGGTLTARELSERIAAAETGESPPPANIRQSAYVSLHQTHLPKLDTLGIVEYDEASKRVVLTDRADRVSVYLETVPTYGLAWSEYYLGVSVLGLLLVIAGEVGVPVLASVGSLTLATVAFLLLIGSAVYQTVSQRSSMVHRLFR